MNESEKPGTPATEPLDAAFAALAKYNQGSDRGALLPIDRAVFAAAKSPELRALLETRLIAAFKAAPSAPAREYAAAKLGLLGSAPGAAAMTPEEFKAPADTAIRTALEATPGPEATKSLLALLPRADGDLKIGVIASLGVRHDANTVRALSSLLHDADPKVVGACLGALARTGTRAAANALRGFVPENDALKPVYADALIRCGDHLRQDGNTADARALYEQANQPGMPEHVRSAANRGLQGCS